MSGWSRRRTVAGAGYPRVGPHFSGRSKSRSAWCAPVGRLGFPAGTVVATVFVIGSIAFASWFRAETEAEWRAMPKRSLGSIPAFGKCTEQGEERLPADLEEAIADLLRMLNPEQQALLRDYEPRWWHRGLGTALRNCWGLWSAKSPLGDWFHARQIFHPDDMSGIILRSLHRRLRGQSLDLDGQIAYDHAYWKKQEEEYQKGTNSGNALYHLVPSKKDEGWVGMSAERVPHINDLVTPIIEQGRAPVEVCWKRFPKTTRDQRLVGTLDDRAVKTLLRIRIASDGRLVSSEVVESELSAHDAACLAHALVGVSIPAHAGATYTLELTTYRHVDPS